MSKLGNKNREVHGGAGALQAHQKGRDFVGLAAEQAKEVREEMQANGPDVFIQRNAEGLQVVADLYLAAIMKASEEGDQAKIDSYVKTWGWVVNSALRAMIELRKIRKDRGNTNVIDVLNSYKDRDHGEENDGD